MKNSFHPYLYPMNLEVTINLAINKSLRRNIKPFVEYSIIVKGTELFEIEVAKTLENKDKNEVATFIYRDFDIVEVSCTKPSQYKLYRRLNPNDMNKGFVELPKNSFILGQTQFEIEEREEGTKLIFNRLGNSKETETIDFGPKEEQKIGRVDLINRGYAGDDVSREHAILKKKNNKFYIKDEYSTGGTYIPLVNTEALKINRLGGLRITSAILLKFVNQESTLMIDYEINKLVNYGKASIGKDIEEPITITPIGKKKYERYKIDTEGFYKRNLSILREDFENIKEFSKILIGNIPVNPIFSVNDSMELEIKQTYLEKLTIDTAYYNKNFLYRIPGCKIPESCVYFYCVECGEEDRIFDYLACDYLYRTYNYLMSTNTFINVFMLCKDDKDCKKLSMKGYEVIKEVEAKGVSKDTYGILAAIGYVFGKTKEEDFGETKEEYKTDTEYTEGNDNMLYIVFPQNKKENYEEALNYIERKGFPKSNKDNIKAIQYSPNIFKYKENIRDTIREYKSTRFSNETLFYAAMKFCYLNVDSGEAFKKEELHGRSKLLLDVISSYEEFKRDAFYAARDMPKEDREITEIEYTRSRNRMSNLVASKIPICEEECERDLLNLIVELPNLFPRAITFNDFKALSQLLINLVEKTHTCNKHWGRALPDKLLFLFASINCIYTLLTILAMSPKSSGNVHIP